MDKEDHSATSVTFTSYDTTGFGHLDVLKEKAKQVMKDVLKEEEEVSEETDAAGQTVSQDESHGPPPPPSHAAAAAPPEGHIGYGSVKDMRKQGAKEKGDSEHLRGGHAPEPERKARKEASPPQKESSPHHDSPSKAAGAADKKPAKEVASAGEKPKARAGGGRRHSDKRNFVGTEKDKHQPDKAFYNKYLHHTLEKKPAYPILKGFLNKVLEHYGPEEFPYWFDGGAGTCGTMQAVLDAGRQMEGVELSDVSQTTCRDLHKAGLVQSSPLHEIPHDADKFDLVFSSEVLEHVPPDLARKSVEELVRVSKSHIFATISLRPSALDKPGQPPKVHLTVRPREWWEKLFEDAGCCKNKEVFEMFQQYDKKGNEISPRYFPFICKTGEPCT